MRGYAVLICCDENVSRNVMKNLPLVANKQGICSRNININAIWVWAENTVNSGVLLHLHHQTLQFFGEPPVPTVIWLMLYLHPLHTRHLPIQRAQVTLGLPQVDSFPLQNSTPVAPRGSSIQQELFFQDDVHVISLNPPKKNNRFGQVAWHLEIHINWSPACHTCQVTAEAWWTKLPLFTVDSRSWLPGQWCRSLEKTLPKHSKKDAIYFF